MTNTIIKLAKRYIIYVLVFALIYLVMPIFFQGENYKYDAVEYQFVFPAAALLGGLIYSWFNGLDFVFPVIAPVIYMGSAIIYSHYYHWMIYVFIYLIVGTLGCFIGDMVYNAAKRPTENDKTYKAPQHNSNRPNTPQTRSNQKPVSDNKDYTIKITHISVDKSSLPQSNGTNNRKEDL